MTNEQAIFMMILILSALVAWCVKRIEALETTEIKSPDAARLERLQAAVDEAISHYPPDVVARARARWPEAFDVKPRD